MAPFKIKRRLGRQYLVLLTILLLATPLLALGMKVLLADYARSPNDDNLQKALLMAAVVVVILFMGMGYSVWQLAKLDRHPDLARLSRYGPLAELLPAIEADLADPERVTLGGEIIGDVWLTRSWLVYVMSPVTRLKFFRLDSIIVAARIEKTVWLVDQYDTTLAISGTDAGVTRLLAEILARVPWVLNHFDRETGENPTANRQQIIAQVEQRREQIMAARQKGSEPPGSSRRSDVQGLPG